MGQKDDRGGLRALSTTLFVEAAIDIMETHIDLAQREWEVCGQVRRVEIVFHLQLTPHFAPSRRVMETDDAQYWMVKQEPEAYSWDDFVRDGATEWTGVRNFQARNNLRSMRRGDRVLFYHSVTTKAVVGIAEVSREAFPDPTATEGNWDCVELKPVSPLSRPVTLEQIKAHPQLQNIALVKQSRLSVLPLQASNFQEIVRIGGAK